MARILHVALVAGLCLPHLALAFNVYSVGGDGACGYAFIQDAIDAAAANPGEDYVFIASNRGYADQHLVVTDQDVDIVGGFPDCTQLGDPGLAQTTIGGTSGHSVFEIDGNSHVYLSNLVITGAVMDDSHHGGGIYFGGAGGLTVRYSWVFLNQAGYGYAGILVAFIARHQPLAIIPVAILFGGFGAAGSLLQRRLGLPDASVLLLQGIAFVLILASEALRERDWKPLLAALGRFGPSDPVPVVLGTPEAPKGEPR